jgi:hypothetical protein
MGSRTWLPAYTSHPVARFRRGYDQTRRSIIRLATALYKGLSANFDIDRQNWELPNDEWLEGVVTELIAKAQDEK